MNETPPTVRLLIADDNGATRAATAALLETGPRPVQIWEAADGVTAVQLAERVQPHVALLDVQMPRLNGIAATRQIKQRWPEIRIIVQTMYGQYQGPALAAGADRFLSKGCSPAQLLAVVFLVT
jgi:CheY-like chemotaxis protein